MDYINYELIRKKNKGCKDVIPLPVKCIGEPKINGYYRDICVEVVDVDDDSIRLLTDCGCFGATAKPSNNLVLSLVEAFFLQHTLNILQITDNNVNLTNSEAWQKFCGVNFNFVEQFVVYSYYRAKNWIVRSGIKFGGDFLLYKYGPQYFHASFLVFINTNNSLQTTDLQRIYRVAETTGKDTLIVSVIYPNCSIIDYLTNIKNFEIMETIPKRFVQNGEREDISK